MTFELLQKFDTSKGSVSLKMSENNWVEIKQEVNCLKRLTGTSYVSVLVNRVTFFMLLIQQG